MYVCHIGNSFYSEIINTAKSKKKKKVIIFKSQNSTVIDYIKYC